MFDYKLLAALAAVVEQGGFELFDKQPFSSHLEKRFIQQLVAAGCHTQQTDVQP